MAYTWVYKGETRATLDITVMEPIYSVWFLNLFHWPDRYYCRFISAYRVRSYHPTETFWSHSDLGNGSIIDAECIMTVHNVALDPQRFGVGILDTRARLRCEGGPSDGSQDILITYAGMANGKYTLTPLQYSTFMNFLNGTPLPESFSMAINTCEAVRRIKIGSGEFQECAGLTIGVSTIEGHGTNPPKLIVNDSLYAYETVVP